MKKNILLFFIFKFLLIFIICFLAKCKISDKLKDVSFHNEKEIKLLPKEALGIYIDRYTSLYLNNKNDCGSRYLEIHNNTIQSYCGDILLAFCPIKNIIHTFRHFKIDCDKITIGEHRSSRKYIDMATRIPVSFKLILPFESGVSISSDFTNTLNGNYNLLVKLEN